MNSNRFVIFEIVWPLSLLCQKDIGNETETEMTEEVFTKNLISLATALAAALDLAVTFYLIWRLTGSGLGGPLPHPWMSLPQPGCILCKTHAFL